MLEPLCSVYISHELKIVIKTQNPKYFEIRKHIHKLHPLIHWLDASKEIDDIK